MNTELFRQFKEIAYRQAGIDLRSGKEALVAARVAKRIRALGLEDEAAYLGLLQQDQKGDEMVEFLDAISTNFTSFYRESVHFDLLREHARALKAEGHQRLRFWSAASSSGEEPYSMAITLTEALGEGADFRILATDISTRVLGRAQAGEYAADQVEPVAPALRERYFTAAPGGTFRVKDALKRRVHFTRLNLATPPFPMSGPLDTVLCRNVMIYFDQPVRQRLVSEIERLLRPGSYLLIGHTETLNGLRTGLQMVRPSVYRKPLAPEERT